MFYTFQIIEKNQLASDFLTIQKLILKKMKLFIRQNMFL